MPVTTCCEVVDPGLPAVVCVLVPRSRHDDVDIRGGPAVCRCGVASLLRAALQQPPDQSPYPLSSLVNGSVEVWTGAASPRWPVL